MSLSQSISNNRSQEVGKVRNALQIVIDQIVPATEDDWPWIIEGQIEIAWARLGRERQGQEDRAVVAQRVIQKVARLRRDSGLSNQVLVALGPKGERMGFVWVAAVPSDATGNLEASLLNQFVSAPYRGRGLGERLMKAAEGWARQHELPRICLRVARHNMTGQKLYRTLGFEVDMLRMSKTLNEGAESDPALDIY